MGEKPAKYVRGLEARLVSELAENLSVPAQTRREVLRPIAEDALRITKLNAVVDWYSPRRRGTPETIRTSDPSLRRRMLYPLSYWG